MIAKNIEKQIHKALKGKDKVRVSTLKLLSAELHNALIDNRRKPLSKEQEMSVVQKEAKKRRDAIELYEKGGAKDKADQEKAELEILKEYLPKEMSDEELEKIVTEAIKKSGAKETADMGRVMGMVMAQVKGKADGTRVSELVKEKLAV